MAVDVQVLLDPRVFIEQTAYFHPVSHEAISILEAAKVRTRIFDPAPDMPKQKLHNKFATLSVMSDTKEIPLALINGSANGTDSSLGIPLRHRVPLLYPFGRSLFSLSNREANLELYEPRVIKAYMEEFDWLVAHQSRDRIA